MLHMQINIDGNNKKQKSKVENYKTTKNTS